MKIQSIIYVKEDCDQAVNVGAYTPQDLPTMVNVSSIGSTCSFEIADIDFYIEALQAVKKVLQVKENNTQVNIPRGLEINKPFPTLTNSEPKLISNED